MLLVDSWVVGGSVLLVDSRVVGGSVLLVDSWVVGGSVLLVDSWVVGGSVLLVDSWVVGGSVLLVGTAPDGLELTSLSSDKCPVGCERSEVVLMLWEVVSRPGPFALIRSSQCNVSCTSLWSSNPCSSSPHASPGFPGCCVQSTESLSLSVLLAVLNLCGHRINWSNRFDCFK